MCANTHPMACVLINFTGQLIWRYLTSPWLRASQWERLFFWNARTTDCGVCVCVCLCVCSCACLWASRGSECSEAPTGLFSTEFSPWRHQSHYTQQPSTDWLHSAAVLEIEFFLSPTGTNHITFTLFIPLFCHRRLRAHTHRHADSYSFT